MQEAKKVAASEEQVQRKEENRDNMRSDEVREEELQLEDMIWDDEGQEDSEGGKETVWDAIDQALVTLYPDQKGIFYGTQIPYFLGGQDPLDGISIFSSEKGLPHWHYITYGFSEPVTDGEEDGEVSGYGFELTFRLVCRISVRMETASKQSFHMRLWKNCAGC